MNSEEHRYWTYSDAMLDAVRQDARPLGNLSHPTKATCLRLYIPLPDRWALPDGWDTFYPRGQMPTGIEARQLSRYAPPMDLPTNFLRLIVRHVPLAESEAFPQALASALVLDAYDPNQPRDESGPYEITVIEASTLAPPSAEPLSESPFEPLFNEAVEEIQRLQLSWIIKTMHRTDILTVAKLPPRLLASIETVGSDPSDRRLGEFFLGSGVRRFIEQPHPSPATVEVFEQDLDADPRGNLITAFLLLVNEAMVALDDRGDTRSAILACDTACEILFDTVLALLLWEEGAGPDDAAAAFTPSLVNRVRAAYAERLGGSWSVTGDGPIALWRTQISLPRHRAMYAGRGIATAEAADAIATCWELKSFVFDRFASDRARGRYRRATFLLVGEDGLRRRNAFSRQFRVLANDANKVMADFSNFAHTLARSRFGEPFRGGTDGTQTRQANAHEGP